MGYNMQMLTNIKNPKISLFYENEIPYLAIELETKTYNSNNKLEDVNIKIHKIRLDTIGISTEEETVYWADKTIPPKRYVKSRKIEFEIEPVVDKLFTITIDYNKKKMTKEEIEKELGYEIEIIE